MKLFINVSNNLLISQSIKITPYLQVANSSSSEVDFPLAFLGLRLFAVVDFLLSDASSKKYNDNHRNTK